VRKQRQSGLHHDHLPQHARRVRDQGEGAVSWCTATAAASMWTAPT
jgi:hypothetical protein